VIRLWRRLHYLVARQRIEAELASEMQEHRDRLADPRRFGSMLRLREQSRDAWGWEWLDAAVRDLRLAIRSLWHARGFVVAVVVPLAAGLAVLAVILSVGNAYLFRALPYPVADRLYRVHYAPPGPYEPDNVSTIDWNRLRDVVEYPVAAHGETFYFGTGGQGVRAAALRVTPDFVAALGVRTVLGRTFQPEDFAPGAGDPALIGERLWRTRFAGDPGVIGRRITVDVEGQQTPESFRIIGVLTPNFWFGRESSALIDIMLPGTTTFTAYLVRLRPGVAPALAEHRITQATREAATNLPAGWTGVHLESLRADYVASFRTALIVVIGAAALLLLIVCGNVAVLVLLRATRRSHEVDIRLALGAGRRHVVRLLAIEPLLLAAVAGTFALAAARILLQLLNPLIEQRLQRPAPGGVATINLDTPVVAAVVVAALVTALALALAPVLVGRRGDLAGALRAGSRTSSESRTARRVRSLLIGLEIAGTVVLMASCGSLLRNILALTGMDLGFRTSGLVRVATVVPGRLYPDSIALIAFYQRLARGVAGQTGSPVALVSWPPYYEAPSQRLLAEGNAGASAGEIAVGPHFFSLLGIPLRAGREFDDGDVPGSVPVAIVSQSLARELWPSENPIGRRIRTMEPERPNLSPIWRTVVAVAGDVHQTYHDRDLRDIYLPYYQAKPGRYGSFYVGSSRPPDAVARDVRTALAVTDPRAVVRHATTPAEENAELRAMRFLAGVSLAFGAFATVLSLLGMYGVVAYAVGLREREVAIRMAVGATRPVLTRMFLVSGVRPLVAGTLTGAAAVMVASRLLSVTIPGVALAAPLPLALAVVVMLATGLAANWWPARRAGQGGIVGLLSGN
jgi:putative ABC transport system permease protein